MAPKSAVKGKSPATKMTTAEKLEAKIAELKKLREQEQKEEEKLDSLCQDIYNLQSKIQEVLGETFTLRFYKKNKKIDFMEYNIIVKDKEADEDADEEVACADEDADSEDEGNVDTEEYSAPVYENIQVALMEEENQITAEFRNFIQPLVQRCLLDFENRPAEPNPEHYISTQQLVDLYRGDILKPQNIRNMFAAMCRNQFDQSYVSRNKKRVYLGFRLLEGSSGTSSDTMEQE